VSQFGPDPNAPFPIEHARRVGFLKNFITQPNIVVGDFTYYDDPDGPTAFERRVLYHFDFIGDVLRIGKFCAIAAQTTFIMNGANHRAAGVSTYPFAIFGNGWSDRYPAESTYPEKGDTVVENDVWIGYRSILMPGVRVGKSAIVATASTVTSDVADYAIVGGNPAREICKRYDERTIARLLAVRWWDWDIEKVTRNVAAIGGTDIAALERAT